MRSILLYLHLMTSLRSEFFYFGINNIVESCNFKDSEFAFFISLWNYQVCGNGCGDASKFFWKIFLFTVSGYNLAPTCDLDTKIASCQRLQCRNQRFPTFGQLFNMSETCLRLSQLRSSPLLSLLVVPK